MQESQTEHTKEAVLLKNQGSEFYKYANIATTLLARDYKGVANQPFNAVIEVKNDKQSN